MSSIRIQTRGPALAQFLLRSCSRVTGTLLGTIDHLACQRLRLLLMEWANTDMQAILLLVKMPFTPSIKYKSL